MRSAIPSLSTRPSKPSPAGARRLFAAALPWLVGAALLAAPQAGFAAFSGDPLHPMGRGVTVELIIGRFVSVVLGLIGSLSLLMFVYGGLTWMTAQGNEEKIKKAKNTIVYAVLGLIVAFSAYEILRLFFNDILRGALTTSTS